MELRQLLPEPGAVELQSLLDGLAPQARAPAGRPYVAVNFILSADGHATFHGRSGALGDEGDRSMFHGLREQFDAVMAGTGTLAAERYGRILARAERRRRRSERGLAPEPLACILTRSGSVPGAIPLFDEPEARVAILSPEPVPDPGWQAQVEQVHLDADQPQVATALLELRRRFGVRALLCEGGPTLFAGLLSEGVVDELFLTLAPKLAGGGHGPPASRGPEVPVPVSARLKWVLERQGFLYLRYALR